MQIVDFHTHIVPSWVIERRDELSCIDACFGMLYSNPKAKLVTAEDLVRGMDDAGVATSVALNVGWSDHELCCRTNDYLLECGSRWPDRIIPFCMVQPTAGDAALRELERCAAAGARGIGELRPDVQGYHLANAALLAPFVNFAVTKRMIVLAHVSEPVGHTYPGKGTVWPEQPYAFARAFPDATLVCAHWGGGLPFYALMPEVAKELANVYFDTAATQYLYRPDVFDAVSRIIGASRILFGSDFPLIRQSRALEEVRGAHLPDHVETAIIGANAAGLLNNRGALTDG